jgi:hypothetical protein
LDRGGALFVARSSGYGRIDNPDIYDVLYVAADPHAAIAETFGRFPVWRAQTFVNASGFPYAMATIDVSPEHALFEMNDIDALRSIGITHPTDVVTRDRDVTQTWARTIFERGGFAGVSWWSFYNPVWQIVGLWDTRLLALAEPTEILTIDRRVVVEAARTIVRQISR